MSKVSRKSQIGSIAKLPTVLSDNDFLRTGNNQLIIKEKAILKLFEAAENLEDIVFMRFIFESASRISELLLLKKEDIKGNIITMHTAKKHSKCQTCKTTKRYHRERIEKGVNKPHEFIEIEEVHAKRVYITHETLGLIKVYMKKLKSEYLFPYSDDYYNKLLQKYHPELTTKLFRASFCTFMQNHGADSKTIAAYVNHNGTRTIEDDFYTPSKEYAAIDFIEGVYNGENRRKLSDYTFDEFMKEFSKRFNNKEIELSQ